MREREKKARRDEDSEKLMEEVVEARRKTQARIKEEREKRQRWVERGRDGCAYRRRQKNQATKTSAGTAEYCIHRVRRRRWQARPRRV